ncbi:hypothetical protein AX15_007207 [Amanita polypyramis BW_CC]|nr:hypothetical protein AX15_007207 [Amanita polypyramis BW_CC]
MIFLSPLYTKPNNIIERQKIIQSDLRPIMLRLPRSGLYVGTFGVLFTVGMLATTYGCVSLVKGKTTE